ncbi:MAG: HAD family hydrolase [Anaerolineae bacterium]|nr:HAD family hydrolase [Anaerolineae bacterium]
MHIPNTIRAVIFDLDGTLRINRPAINKTFYQFAKELGLTSSRVQQHNSAQWAHFYWAQSDTLASDLEALGHDDERFWSNYIKRNLVALGCTEENAAKIAPKMRDKMKNQVFSSVVPDDVLQTLQSLKNAGYTIGLVSNRRHPIADELKELGLSPLLDFAYVAGEVALWKPNPKIFDRAIAESGVAREQIIYVGDNYYADIVGAKRAGMVPILIDPDQVFPDAECTIIQSIGEIPGLLPASINIV